MAQRALRDLHTQADQAALLILLAHTALLARISHLAVLGPADLRVVFNPLEVADIQAH